MSKHKQIIETVPKSTGMRRHNRSNGRSTINQDVSHSDPKFKVISDEGSPHPILQRISTLPGQSNLIHRSFKTNKWESLSMRG